jgi:opacity protein-like surface antigen
VLFALSVVLPWRVSTAVLALGGFGVSVTAVALWQFLRVAHDPVAHRGFFVVGRLATPISYPNADCALLAMAALPLVVLASRREVPLLARGLFLACGGIAIELVIASQSRLSVLAAPLAIAILFAIVGGRVRLVLTAIPVLVVVAIFSRTILHIYDALGVGAGQAALGDARRALLVTGVVLLVAGWAGAAVDLRVERGPRIRRFVSVLAVAAVVAVVAGGAVVVQRAVPHPIAFARAQWNGFVTGTGYYEGPTSHFTSIGTNRYAIWRVAAHEFTASPIGGVGADNYPVDYLRERRTPSENPLYPHSILLTIAAQTGVLGGLAFLAFLGTAGLAVARIAGRGGSNAVVGVACVAPFLYFFLHGLGDWFWEIPALGAPALAFLAVGVRLAGGGHLDRGGGRIPGWAVVAGAGVALLSFGLPWLSARETSLAASHWPENLPLAYDRLKLADRLDPLSDQPATTQGVIAARAGDPSRAQAAFERAIGRNSVGWYSYLELAVADSQLGQRSAARAALERAKELNPVEPLLGTVEQRFRARRPLTQAFLDGLITAADKATVGAR